MNDKHGWMKSLIRAKLTDKEKLVGAALWNYTNAEGERAFPGTFRLAEDLSISEKTVTRALAVLRVKGWIVKSLATRSRKQADEYRLTFPDDQRTQLCPSISAADETEQRTNRTRMTDTALSTTNGHSYVLPTDHLTNHSSTDQEKVPGESAGLGKKALAGSKAQNSLNKKTRTVSTTLPAHFSVTDGLRSWAREKAPNAYGSIELETEKFRDYHHAKGSKFVDWEAAWKYWMLNAEGRAKEKTPASRGADWF